MIEFSQQVNQSYFYWRIRILYSIWLGYIMFYFSRLSFNYSKGALVSDLNMDLTDLGLVGTAMFLCYGLSKFTGGILADRLSPRLLMALGLIVTGFINIAFGLSSSLWIFALLWGLNGWFQGLGAPPCAKLLLYWYAQRERGRWWSAWSTAHNIGSSVIAFIVTYCIYYSDWRTALYVPGVICIFGGLFLLNRLRDKPEDLGLPCIEEFKHEAPKSSPATKDEKLPLKELLFEHILNNRPILLLAGAYFFVYVVRMGLSGWSTIFLAYKGCSPWLIPVAIFLYEAGGFLGNISAGWLSDKVFHGQRGPINAIYTMGIVCSTVALYCTPPGWWMIDLGLMATTGFFVFGPQVLIGVAAAELADKKAGASSNGFVGLFAYLGGAAAEYPLAVISKAYGWNSFFLALVICALLALAFLLPLWSVVAKDVQERVPKQEPEPEEKYA